MLPGLRAGEASPCSCQLPDRQRQQPQAGDPVDEEDPPALRAPADQAQEAAGERERDSQSEAPIYQTWHHRLFADGSGADFATESRFPAPRPRVRGGRVPLHAAGVPEGRHPRSARLSAHSATAIKRSVHAVARLTSFVKSAAGNDCARCRTTYALASFPHPLGGVREANPPLHLRPRQVPRRRTAASRVTTCNVQPRVRGLTWRG